MSYSFIPLKRRPVAHYPPGAVRYRRWEDANTNMDIRCYRPPKGWSAMAEDLEYHPITGEKFRDENGENTSEWWITEMKNHPHDDDDDI